MVLPAACFAEKDGTFTNTERRVQRVRKAVEPPGEATHDWEIICRPLDPDGIPHEYDSAAGASWTEIRQVTPSYAGITYERLGKPGHPVALPDTDHPGTKYLHKDRFTRGLGLFAPIEFSPARELPDKDYPLILTTGRVLYQYHTGTMTRLSGLQRTVPRRASWRSTRDAAKYGITDGRNVSVASRRGAVEAKASVTEAPPRGRSS